MTRSLRSNASTADTTRSALACCVEKAFTIESNPQPEDRWGYYDSIGMVRELMGDRMYPLTLGGLEAAMRELSH